MKIVGQSPQSFEVWDTYFQRIAFEEKKDSDEPDYFADFSEQEALEVYAMAYRHNPKKFGNRNEKEKPKEKMSAEQAKCFKCEEIGHFYRDCEKPQEFFFCFACGKRDQISTKCDSTFCVNRRKQQA